MIVNTTPRPAHTNQLGAWLHAFLSGQPTPVAVITPAAYEVVDLADPYWVDSQFPEQAPAEHSYA